MKGHKKHRAYGGVVDKDEPAKDAYAGGESNVRKEANEKAAGGRVGRKFGGKIDSGKDLGKIEGKAAKMHLGRPGRKSGGRVGADSSPLSSAAKTSNAPGHDASECG